MMKKRFLAVLLVLAAMLPMMTFGVYADYGPSAADLDGIDATCDYPRRSDYLDDYEYMYVLGSNNSGAVYCLHGLNDGSKWKAKAIKVDYGTAVCVLAIHSYKSGGKTYSYACCMFESDYGPYAGWINMDYLTYDYEDYGYTGGYSTSGGSYSSGKTGSTGSGYSYGPSAKDLDAVSATCDYPKSSDYLTSYRYMEVESTKSGGSVYCLHGLNDGSNWKDKAIQVPDGTEVTVIAIHSYKSGGKTYSYACCIFENSRGHMKAGWINMDYLDD